jgi:hypothetical protein
MYLTNSLSYNQLVEEHGYNIFIVSFLLLLFHRAFLFTQFYTQRMHSYILLKYYHRQLHYWHFSLLHVSIRTDRHQGVLLYLAKLLIKIIIKLKV